MRSNNMRDSTFSLETTGGMEPDAIELIDQIGLACRDHLVLENHLYIFRGVRASVQCRGEMRWPFSGDIAERLCEVDMVKWRQLDGVCT
jgi:hypothetical protein